jgi:transcriptional regulator with XRE-family HTH domain
MASPAEETFGAFLKRLRKDKKVSLLWAAAVCGIDKDTLWHLENDLQEPSYSTLKCLSIYYDVTLDELCSKKMVAKEKKKKK